MDTEACDRQVGSVMLQKQEDGNEQPNENWSRTPGEPEKNLYKSHWESRTIVQAVLLLRLHLEVTKRNIRTDHHAMRWILNLTDATGKHARWCLRLMEFDHKVNHKAGVQRQAADALTGFRTNETDNQDFDDKVLGLPLQQQSREEKHQIPRNCQNYDDSIVNLEPHPIMKAKADDIELPTITDFVIAQSKERFCDQMKQLVRPLTYLFIFDKSDRLVRWARLNGSIQRIVLISLCPIILYLARHYTSTGQPGKHQIHNLLRRYYY